MKSKVYQFTIYLILISFVFIVEGYGQCTSNSSQWPSSNYSPASCNGTNQTITSSGYATEYSIVNVTAGNTYTFSSSIGTDYLTIANTLGGAPVYVFGTSPVVWTATFTGSVRMYDNTNSSCGTNTTTRTRYVACSAPVPSNDNCSGAFSVTVNSSNSCASTTTATSSGATQSQAACGSGNADDDVWFSFTATATTHTITVTPGTMSDVVLQTFTGACGSLTTYTCVDNTGTSSAEIAQLSGLTINNTYYFRVFSYGTTSGTFTTCITSSPVPPANDNCSGAFTVAVNSSNSCVSTTSATSTNATQSQAACGTGNADDDVWFSFTATATSHTITITPGTMSDVVLQTFTGACGSLSTYTCVDNSSGSSTETANLSGLTINNVYYFRVFSYGTTSGTFTACITSPPPVPANNDCAGSFTVPVNSSTNCAVTSTATSTGATQSLAGCTGNADDDVWFSFTAAATTQTITVTPGTINDVVIQSFTGTCGSLTTYTCVDNSGGTSVETANLSGLTIGNIYYFRVYSFATTSGTFTLCITTPAPPPSNDNCSGAIGLTVNSGSTCVTTTSATSSNATQSQAACAGTADDDVWFSFTAGATTQSISVTPGTMNNAVFEVFSGSCASLTTFSCSNSTTGASVESSVISGLTVSSTYFVRVHSAANAAGAGTFSICVTTPPPPPGNDNCSGSYTVPVNSSTSCAVTYTATSNNATQSQSGCTGTADDDVWFSFTATSTDHIITITPGTMSDVVLQVFSGTCSSLSSLDCEDNTGTTVAESATLSGLIIGNVYYFRVYSYGNASGSGTFTACITTPYSPCNSVTNIASCGSTINATIASGTGLYGTSACGWTTDGNELIYTFTPTTTGAYAIQQFSSFDYIDYQYKAVSAGCSSSGWACFNDLSGAATSPYVTLTAGVQYYILLDPESTAGGNISFTIKCPPTPPGNDDCPGAISAAVSSGTTCISLTNGTLLGSTASSQANGCNAGDDDHDVWYSFVATSTTHSITINNVAGSPTDLYHSVYAGSCGTPGAAIVCSDPNNSTVNGLTAGNTYYIRIYTYSSATNPSSTFSVCIKTGPNTGACGNPTTNDYCSNPATLTQGAGTFSSSTSSIYSADQSSNLSSIFCGSIENNSWYQFVATGSTASFPFTSITNCTWGDGVQAHVYSVTHNASGCCTAFTSVSNCYNPGTTSTGTVTATGLTTGQTYVLMVDGYAGDVCNFTVSGWTAVGILPMELLTFVGRNENDKNKLQWVTASEENTKLFTLEKSKDGIAFEKLLDVDAAGISSSPKNYSAFDLDPFKEITYYRLKLVNTNNSFEYSNVIAIDNKNLTDYISNARPNPTNGNIEFDINLNSKEKILIEIYSNTGSLISSEEKLVDSGYKSLNLDLNKYDSGIYLLKVSFENSGKTEIQKIIKQ